MNDRFSPDIFPSEGGSASAANQRRIDLAHVPPLRIGKMEVRPASREVVSGERREMLEPKVMQVLVALALARGEILTRDDLIAACWDGLAVSDDAIHRVISRLRALSRTFGSFEVETIIKVGYQLIETEGDQAPAELAESPDRTGGGPAIPRRAVLLTGLAAALCSGALLWRQQKRHRVPPEAVELFKLGEISQRQGYPDQVRQTLSYYERAVAIEPLYADAWGAYALAHTHLLEGLSDAALEGVPDRLRSAAKRALELDGDNADAHVALGLVRPSFRNWASVESDLQRLRERFPDHWLLLARSAVLLLDVGRIGEAITFFRRAIEVDPMLPVAHAFLADALLNGGRIQEAEEALNRAQDRWPAHPWLWSARYRHLIYSNRPQSAAEFVRTARTRPSATRSEDIELRLGLARAVETRAPADVAATLKDFEQFAVADISNIPFASAVFALLGRDDLTFASLDRYYFNRGSFGPASPIGPYTRRFTRGLFSPPFARLHRDPRFINILERIGLRSYWRDTATRPDFRRLV